MRLPDPDDDEEGMPYTPPPFGIHPLLDIMSMQWFITRQQHDIWAHFTKVHRLQRLQALLWMVVSALLLFSTIPGFVQAWHLFF